MVAHPREFAPPATFQNPSEGAQLVPMNGTENLDLVGLGRAPRLKYDRAIRLIISYCLPSAAHFAHQRTGSMPSLGQCQFPTAQQMLADEIGDGGDWPVSTRSTARSVGPRPAGCSRLGPR